MSQWMSERATRKAEDYGEKLAEERDDAWMYVTEADEDAAEARWARKGVL